MGAFEITGILHFTSLRLRVTGAVQCHVERVLGVRDLIAIAFVFTYRLTIRWAKCQNLLKKNLE